MLVHLPTEKVHSSQPILKEALTPNQGDEDSKYTRMWPGGETTGLGKAGTKSPGT